VERPGGRRARVRPPVHRGARRGALALRLCLDTSAYSRFKGGDPSAVERIDAAEWLGVPTIVLGELEAGFRLGARPAHNLDELERFLTYPVVHELAVDRGVAREYGEIVTTLRRKGILIPTNEVWIAACAARSGATVLTYDAHFEAVDRIGVLLLEAA
jgi:tRNA(fMet)-specific endonuclease VapC